MENPTPSSSPWTFGQALEPHATGAVEPIEAPAESAPGANLTTVPSDGGLSPLAGGPTRRLVTCSAVTKSFGAGETKTWALQGIDLEIQGGEMTLLVGPSGCGKTTLISIIAGLLNPSAGNVEVLNERLDHLSNSQLVRFRAKNIGFVFQQYNLLPSLSATENVAVPLLITGVARRDALLRARDQLEMVGLGGRLNARPNQLSGGQQQRVAIARALIHQPKILVCDEPTAALDAQSGQNVMQLLREVAICPDRAVIVVTHDSRIYQFGQRIVEMSDGRIVNNQPIELPAAGEAQATCDRH